MHCLLTALGSYGDVHPMIALGVDLSKRGHDVTLVTNPHFAGLAARAGLEAEFVSTAEEYDRLTRNGALWDPLRGARVVLGEATGLLEALHPLIDRLYRPGETVIAAHGLDLASRVVAETRGAPVVSVVYAPLALWSARRPPRAPVGLPSDSVPRWLAKAQFVAAERLIVGPLLRRPVERFRRGLGLPPLRGGFFDWYYGVAPPVALFPDWFFPDPGDWPAGAVTTGFPLWDGLPSERLSPELERFLAGGEAPVVFTPGSANRHAAGFFRAAVEACRLTGRRGVLLTKYPEQIPQGLPPAVGWFGFTPLSRLLPRCAAFVHHGGIGSSAQALAAGAPQLVWPLAFDQFDNARRLCRLGVAEELPRRRFTGQTAAVALERLLGSEKTREACARWAPLCDGPAALGAACRLLESRLEGSAGGVKA